MLEINSLKGIIEQKEAGEVTRIDEMAELKKHISSLQLEIKTNKEEQELKDKMVKRSLDLAKYMKPSDSKNSFGTNNYATSSSGATKGVVNTKSAINTT